MPISSRLSAINGTVTVTMSAAPTVAPVPADFTIMNGTTAVTASAAVQTGTQVVLTVPMIAATATAQSIVYSVAYQKGTAMSAAAFTVAPITSTSNFTFTQTTDIVGNTVVNVTPTISNVSGVTVQGTAATYIPTLSMWRAVLTGSVTVVNSDIIVTPSTPVTVNAIDTNKTVAIKGFLGDVYYKVFLLSGVTTSSVTSVSVKDSTGITTVLPYNATNGDYEQDVVYTGAIPTSATVSLTTAAGTQTDTVTPN